MLAVTCTVQPTSRVLAESKNPRHPLFERLRAWRVDAARRHGVPAYVIFHDSTLKEIARVRPSSLDSLRGISGVGARKLEAYGSEIVGLVGEFQ